MVAFDPSHGRSHRFSAALYLFQFQHRHLPDEAIIACLRLLLHGLVFQTREGKIVVIKPHLLRHLFATHSVHVESVPVDIVAALLNQKNIDVTEYYSQPTDTIVAEAADAFADAEDLVGERPGI
jgi:integrase